MIRPGVFVFLLWVVAVSAAGPAFPVLSGRVVDAADLLDAANESALIQRLADHESATSDQLVVATVPSLDGLSVEEYANRLFRAWGLGQRDKDNGVLLLVAPDERKVRIEVGYGLEGTLTDLLAGDIIQQRIIPHFKAGDFTAGIEDGVDAILGILGGVPVDEVLPAASGSAEHKDFNTPIFLLLVFSMLSNILFRDRYRPARVAVFGVAGGLVGWWLTHFIPVALFFALIAVLLSVTAGGGSGVGGGGGWSSGGGGGGFSGGGGSSGGGGASGSW